MLKPPHTLGTLPPVRSASEVSKLGEDPVQGLLPVGCVSVGGWSNWRDLLAHSLPGGWGAEADGKRLELGLLWQPGRGLAREEAALCLLKGGIQDCNSARCPGLGGAWTPPDSHSAPSSHTRDVPGYRALFSKAQPVRWGHSGDAYEPLQVAPRLRLSPGGDCQGGDLRAQKADSEDILEQMSIPDSTSLP